MAFEADGDGLNGVRALGPQRAQVDMNRISLEITIRTVLSDVETVGRTLVFGTFDKCAYPATGRK